ncbi:MAG: BACON domain-containing protein [Odoribacteraceae bacterium]|jgi:hypothetical protein|nr:BACON domain-containing protein [Odoribacteraceae bacterium]
MKHLTYLLSLLLLAAGCGTDSPTAPFDSIQLHVESADVSQFPATGGTGTITIADATPYTVTVDQPWCTYTTNGRDITITVDENATMTTRTALVTVTAGGRVNYIPVTQAAITLLMDNQVQFLPTGGSAIVPTTCAYPLAVAFPGTPPDWLTVTLRQDTILLDATLNPSLTLPRAATVSVIIGDSIGIVTLAVAQPALTFRVDRGQVKLPVNKSAASVGYTSDLLPSATVDPSATSWLAATITADSIILQAKANATTSTRQGTVTITVTAGSETFTSTINVDQEKLVLDPPDATNITTYEQDPALATKTALMNVKNYSGTTTRLKVTLMCDTIQAWWDALAADILPHDMILQELRLEAPRSTYAYATTVYLLEGATKQYYYWNSTAGFGTPAGGNSPSDLTSNYSGNSRVSGFDNYAFLTDSPYYIKLRAWFAKTTGFTLIQDGNTFWYRDIANPTLWVRFEPTTF